MQQDGSSIGWDPIQIHRDPEPLVKIFVLLSVVALIIVLVRLIRIWIQAPPLKLSRQANNRGFTDSLRVDRDSIRHWLGLMLLGWGFVACTQVTGTCNLLLNQMSVNSTALVFALRDISTSLSLGLFVALCLFLAQWHLNTRLQQLIRISVGS
jgi:hypothetical protein